MWRINPSGIREFTGGKTDWELVANLARECASFEEDVEDELVADDKQSCYNCRFRRWTHSSFECRKKC